MSIGTIWTHRDVIEQLDGREAAEEFEQIVLKYQAEQIAFEQERIIKLLKKYNCILDGSHHSENLCTSPHHLGLLIALIKGEQK